MRAGHKALLSLCLWTADTIWTVTWSSCRHGKLWAKTALPLMTSSGCLTTTGNTTEKGLVLSVYKEEQTQSFIGLVELGVGRGSKRETTKGTSVIFPCISSHRHCLWSYPFIYIPSSPWRQLNNPPRGMTKITTDLMINGLTEARSGCRPNWPQTHNRRFCLILSGMWIPDLKLIK